MCGVAPITAEALSVGDRYAASCPHVRVVRYLVPFHEMTPHRPPADECANAERNAIEGLVGELAASFEPDVLVAGRETLARYIPGLARRHALPAVMLARGNPTGHILDGRYPADDAEIVVAGFRQFARIISVAEYMTEGLRRLGCANITTVPNAIDMTAFTRRSPSDNLRAELRIPTGSPVVLAPGHINQRKRPVDLARSAARVLAKRPEVIYAMAGVGVRQEEVERLCGDGIAANFRFPGWINYSRMPDLVNLADIVVVASEAEGMARSSVVPGSDGLRAGAGGQRHSARARVDRRRPERAAVPVGRCGAPGRAHIGSAGRSSAAGEARTQARLAVEWCTLDRMVPLYLDEFRLAMNGQKGAGCNLRRKADPGGPARTSGSAPL